MAEKIVELREKREKVIQDQRALLDKIEKEKREFTTEEQSEYDNLDVEFERLATEIREIVDKAEKERAAAYRKKRLEEREIELKLSQGHTQFTPNNPNNPDNRNQDPKFAEYRIAKKFLPLIDQFRIVTAGKRSSVEFLNSYKRYLKHGFQNLAIEDRNLLAGVHQEVRALQADSDTIGGYLIAPEQMVMMIIEQLDNLVFIRQYANVIPLPTAASLGAPARDNDIGDVTWTSELATGNADNSLDFGKRELHPHPLARRILVSRKLIRVSLIDIVSYIAGRFAYKMSVVQENAFLNGSGVNQPLGVFIASDAGITTGRDISTGNTSTEIKADGLIECKYNLPKQYRMLPSNRWCFHRDAIKKIRKLKDGEGQYLWKQGLSDMPDTILEMPFEESEYAPNTFTSGKYVGILGDWSTYWIVDSLAFEIQVLMELYALTEQIGYICRQECDGMPVQEAAWSRLKLA